MYFYSFYIKSNTLNKRLAELDKNNNRYFKLRKGKSYQYYYNIELSFDIETTNVIDYENNIKQAYMYVWQIGLFNDCIYGRTYEELKLFLEYLKVALDNNFNARIIMWIANTSFEFQFIRKHFRISDLFAKEERQPISFVLNDFFECRDALVLSGGSLESLAKQYTKTQKLVGDLNYDLPRNILTPLHCDELAYINNDVIILTEFARYIYDKWAFTKHYIPLTKTGVLRYTVRQKAKADYKINVLYAYISTLYPKTKSEYLFTMEYLFRGGYTHANSFFTDIEVKNSDIRGIDFTSSYPSVMIKDYYPKTPFTDIEIANMEDFETLCSNYCVIFIADFINIKARYGNTIESKNRIIKYSYDAVFDNGRLYKASKIRVYLTELDYLNYKDFYKWDRMVIKNVKISKKGRLPQYLLKPMIDAYSVKQRLKQQDLSDSKEYAESKSVVNSAYGLSVTRLQFNDVVYNNDEWGYCESNKSYEEIISRQVLSPYWGIYVCAHARRNELLTLYEMKEDVIYSDTDSHKLINYSRHKEFIDRYNQNQKNLNKLYCDKYNEDITLLNDIGCFDDEGEIYRFKTLGTKRYCYENKKGIHTVVSGCRKKALIDYSKILNKDVFEIFEDKLSIPKEYSLKLTTCYNDDITSAEITDIYGNTIIQTELSSVALYDIPFSLSMDKDYLDFIKMLIERKKRYEIH